MKFFQLSALREKMNGPEHAWLEFLRVPSLSMGIYHLPVGQVDHQKPHTEDECYYVIAGRAKFSAGDEVKAVQPHDFIFVEKHLPHRFTDITENLTVLVFFAPAEHSLKPPSAKAQ